MSSFNFKKWDLIVGWTVFLIALITYSLTVEPTVSFWDAGEYIATSAKLQVGHPPGAPLYQMLGAFFSMFASSPDKVALMVNMVAVFSSAFTILFLFWSITHLLKKTISSYTDFNSNHAFAVIGSAAVGALAFTFSDSFWFSAVEAEVYATATLLIAILLWLGLKWIEDIDNPRGNRWLLLIALLVGFSFGVHLMALLTIPSIGFLYYFKRYPKVTILNFVVANVVVVAILFFVFKFLFPYALALFGKSEIFMVNALGLPFNSGTIFTFILIVSFFVFSLRYTKQKNKPLANTLILSVLFILIGLSSWLMLPIRSNANVIINENRPSDAAELLAYYNREQYGSESIIYDAYYTAKYTGLDKENPYIDAKPNYERDYETGKYVIVNNYKNAEQNYDSGQKGFMPRMWSKDTSHRINYMRFSKAPSFYINPNYSQDPELVELVTGVRQAFATGDIGLDGLDKFFDQFGEYLIIEKPSFMDNMSYMFDYQFGYMYWRYLMWNFVGRQNDVQGNYDNENGNWISGIKFLDEIRLGSQDNLPSDVLNNKARNTYFFIPFILGLVGFIFHFRKDPKTFYVVLALFLFTSFALKIFLNERPFEPRERDYAVVASFMVFAIWIGFGVYAIYDGLKNYISPKIAGPAIVTLSLLGAPLLMASQNWDDHDRSSRYSALANARAYLDSCDENAILFTIGDNDTFPLWYVQEIEGYRTDVRIVCTSLFQQDWYIDQMKVQAYESAPMPIDFTHDQYVSGTRDVVLIQNFTEDRIDIKQFMNFIKSDDPKTRRVLESGQELQLAPTSKIRIPVDSTVVVKNNIVSDYLHDQIVPYIDVDISDQILYKMRVMMLEIVANNNWERPIYFSGGAMGNEDFLWMKDYLQLNGLVYKLVPIKAEERESNHPLDMGSIDADRMYKTVMNWYWGNMGSDQIYHDPQTRRNSIQYRINLARLADKLVQEDKLDKAKDIADLAMTNMPLEQYGYYQLVDPFTETYYLTGEKQKARALIDQLTVKYQEKLNYYKGFDLPAQNEYAMEIMREIENYRQTILIAEATDKDYFQKLATDFNTYNGYFARFQRPEL